MTKSQSEAQVALANLPIPVCWFNDDLNFMGANSKFLKIFSLNKEEQIVGGPFTQVFDSYGFISILSSFAKAAEETHEFHHSILLNRKLVHYKFNLQKCTEGERLILLTLEDLTPLFEKNQEIEALKVKTEQASRMAILGEMTSGIGHEINGSLTVILAQTDFLKSLLSKNVSPELKAEFDSRLEKIVKTGRRIEKIVNGLRVYGRDASMDPFQSTLVSDLICDSLVLCADRLKDNQIKLIVDDFDPSLEIDCRPAQISQILLNLIGNSKDAVSTLDERWIRLQVRDLGDTIRFALIDSGKGIPEGISGKLTDSFFTTKESGKGTGLGLSISKKIVESHLGQLYIDKSSPNTKFVFELPKGLAAIS